MNKNIDKMSLEERVNSLENTIEDMYFTILTLKTNRKSIELIVELAVIEQFDIDRKDFHEFKVAGFGPKNIPENVQNIIRARQWFMAIMYNRLHHTSHSMVKNYPGFYNFKKESAFRPTYLGAMVPKNEADKRNKLLYQSIRRIINRICNEENIFDERFEE